jgi:hypothetical protein
MKFEDCIAIVDDEIRAAAGLVPWGIGSEDV